MRDICSSKLLLQSWHNLNMLAFVFDIVHRFCPCKRVFIVGSILSEAHRVVLTYIDCLVLLHVCVHRKCYVLRGGMGKIWNIGRRLGRFKVFGRLKNARKKLFMDTCSCSVTE